MAGQYLSDPGSTTDVLIGHPPCPFLENDDPAGSPLLMAAPHAGRHYPPELVDMARVPLEELRRLEDPLVDLLIRNATANGAGTISASYARAWIDLNRRETEIDPRAFTPQPPAHVDHRSPRVTAGLGRIPQATGTGRFIYHQPLPLMQLHDRLNSVHRPYHSHIAKRLEAMRARHGIALLCDMHSMPPLAPAGSADIVVSDRHGRTAAAWLVDAVINWLSGQGYRIARNAPYIGGYGVEKHGRPTASIHAIQIELDRRLYLNAEDLTFNENAAAIVMLIGALACFLQELVASHPEQHRLAAE